MRHYRIVFVIVARNLDRTKYDIMSSISSPTRCPLRAYSAGRYLYR